MPTAVSPRFPSSLRDVLTRAGTLPHSRGSLRDHLIGTHDILTKWRVATSTCLGGLVHSIYGTDAYPLRPLALGHRAWLRSIVGTRVERVAHLFGAVRRDELWTRLAAVDVLPRTVRARGRDGGKLLIPRALVRALLIIECANYAEQTSTAAGLPSPWMWWVLRWRRFWPHGARPSPFALAGTLTEGGEQAACVAYAEATLCDGKRRRRRLQEATSLNPFAAEPLVMLAADALARARPDEAAPLLHRARALSRIWQVAWDKRASAHEWRRLAAVLTRLPEAGTVGAFLESWRDDHRNGSPGRRGLRPRIMRLGTAGHTPAP